MLDTFKNNSMKAKPFMGIYYISKTETPIGVVSCIAQQVPKLHTIHWRFNFKLDGKVISAKKLESLLNA
jgi:hypothetical protein